LSGNVIIVIPGIMADIYIALHTHSQLSGLPTSKIAICWILDKIYLFASLDANIYLKQRF